MMVGKSLPKTPPADEGGGLDADTGSQTLDHTGSMGLRFDEEGMVLPHSILGSLEEFRSYLVASGETELLGRIQKLQGDHPWEASGGQHAEEEHKAFEVHAGPPNLQGNALQHWQTHMKQRRYQQGVLSGLLHRPVQNLLMNKANQFRETQEQRELLNQSLPRICSGYGFRVGSEFWSLPQRFGDDMSGIAATLTRTEKGKRRPVTHIGQPSSIRQESGSIHAESRHPASRTWDQSVYLLQQYEELTKFGKDMDFKKPDIDGLEVIGSGKPFTNVPASPCPSLEKEEEEEENEHVEDDPRAQSDDELTIPALRFCGQLAFWSGNSTSNQGEVGISARLNFEALTGEKASNHLELHNEGNTAICFTWHQLPLPHSFPNLVSQTTSPHFYFKSSAGLILPGETQQVEFIFKSKAPGIQTQLWQLHTHPVLQGGASILVTLWGVALYQDTTADQRRAIETKLEKAVTVKMCRPIIYEVLQGVRTPERCSSPAELYITEDQEFLSKNPKLQYHCQPVEDLKRLWQETTSDLLWDLSVDSLRQAVLSLPEQESCQDSLTKETALDRLNALILQLCAPAVKYNNLTVAAVGKQLWGNLLDQLVCESMLLRNLLGMPEKEAWIEKEPESLIHDPENDETNESKEAVATKVEGGGGSSRSASVEKAKEGEKKG
ncbi:MYCBP-associated protein isoform X2 [Genypterus blacodes]|uniref:MYCBP-associated protein isoform X2 n=1 Tax=Genypterus blacodes TaxID=154954 RepID=UPI003F772022